MEDFESELQKEEYIPRPRWQVWGARVALVFVIIAVALYYWSFFNPFRYADPWNRSRLRHHGLWPD